MHMRPPRSTRTATLFPSTTLFRSAIAQGKAVGRQIIDRALLEPTLHPVVAAIFEEVEKRRRRAAIAGNSAALLGGDVRDRLLDAPSCRRPHHYPSKRGGESGGGGERALFDGTAIVVEVNRDRAIAVIDREGLPVGGRRRSEEHTSELQSLMRISY